MAADLHPADECDTTTLANTLAAAEASFEAIDVAATVEDPAECVADERHSLRAVLKALGDSPCKTRGAEPKQTGFSHWHGDEAAARAVADRIPSSLMYQLVGDGTLREAMTVGCGGIFELLIPRGTILVALEVSQRGQRLSPPHFSSGSESQKTPLNQ